MCVCVCARTVHRVSPYRSRPPGNFCVATCSVNFLRHMMDRCSTAYFSYTKNTFFSFIKNQASRVLSSDTGSLCVFTNVKMIKTHTTALVLDKDLGKVCRACREVDSQVLGYLCRRHGNLTFASFAAAQFRGARYFCTSGWQKSWPAPRGQLFIVHLASVLLWTYQLHMIME